MRIFGLRITGAVVLLATYDLNLFPKYLYLKMSDVRPEPFRSHRFWQCCTRRIFVYGAQVHNHCFHTSPNCKT